tara:strand:- start:143 stop:340 length:198 start_codon:yes stop_codon:yes gene_type:complete
MAIFGWLVLVAIALYVTFYFIAGNLVSMGLGGKTMGLFLNILGCVVIIGIWYFISVQLPFEIRVK